MEADIGIGVPPIRLGLVGLGKIARDQHLPAIARNSAFVLAGTASPDGARAGVPGFADFEAMLAAGLALDAVVFCTPPAVRAGLAVRALASGLHVMLEKPPARSAAEARPLAGAARAADRAIFAAWHSREAPGVAAAAAWLAGRAVRQVELVWRESIDRWHPGQDWLLAEGGFGVFDPAINAFSILTRILPAPLAVRSARLGIPANRAAPAEARIAMRCGDAPVSCDLSILDAGSQRWSIAVDTDAGRLELSEGGHCLAIAGRPVPLDPAAADPGEYPRLYRRFAALIGNREADFDLAPLELVDAAMALGDPVRLAEFHFA